MNLIDRFLGKNNMDANPEPEEVKEDKRITGRIIKVSDKGYGFITSRDIQFTRIFFHWTSLVPDTKTFLDLKVGMHVEFTPQHIPGPGRGWRAIKIKVIE